MKTIAKQNIGSPGCAEANHLCLQTDHFSPINTNYARIYGGPSFLEPDQRCPLVLIIIGISYFNSPSSPISDSLSIQLHLVYRWGEPVSSDSDYDTIYSTRYYRNLQSAPGLTKIGQSQNMVISETEQKEDLQRRVESTFIRSLFF